MKLFLRRCAGLWVLVAVCFVPTVSAQAPLATIGLSQGWATFGQALPAGAAVHGLQVGELTTQTDVKTRWPDGSIRFAVVTVKSPASGMYLVTPAAAASAGSFTPAVPAASVEFDVAGCRPEPNVCQIDVYTATLPAAVSADPWLDGPLVREWRSVVIPEAGGTLHPFLRVNFDTRVYNDSTARVDLTVENVLNHQDARKIVYDLRVEVGGVPDVFTRLAVQHSYLTRWRKVFELGPGGFAAITPDIVPFTLARALPPYLDIIADEVDSTEGDRFDILQAGALEENMPAHGGREELGPFPDWTARYLVHRRPEQRSFVLAHGDLSGSWPIHVRERESSLFGVGPERLVSLDQRPTFWFDGRAEQEGFEYVRGLPLPIQEYGRIPCQPGQDPDADFCISQATMESSGLSPLIPDNAHQPSIAYVPYLFTGDRYYGEEMAFWANYGMLRTNPAGNLTRGGDGILENNETRGFAWALRNLVDAAAYYPGAEIRDYLGRKLAANLQWLDAYANAQDPLTNPLRLLWFGYRGFDESGGGYVALWEQNYLAYAIDRALKQGFSGGQAHRDAIVNLQLLLFSHPDYPRMTADADGAPLHWGAPYLLGAATVTDPTAPWINPIMHTTLAEVAAHTQSDPSTARPYEGFYGPEARLNLIMAIESGMPNAQEAHDYLWPFIGAQNAWCATTQTEDRPDLACRAGWALDFYPAAPPPDDPADDGDDDGIADAGDNCPAVANADQADFDGDAAGDACDPDDDGDGVDDSDDAFPFDSGEWSDRDNDGIGDTADPDDDNDGASDADEIACGSNPLDGASVPLDSDGDGSSDCVDGDDDNDGVADGEDAFPLDSAESVDTDGDGTGNGADTDDDNDSQTDADELACGSNPLDAASRAPDADADHRPDCADEDDDNDGEPDTTDAFPLDPTESVDTDHDGIGNNADPDDDNDGQSDSDEIACGSDPLDPASLSPDSDGDGAPDCLDPPLLVNPGPQTSTVGDHVSLQLEFHLEAATQNAAVPARRGRSPKPHQLRFAAENLPHGLHINKTSGRISGRVGKRAVGLHPVIVTIQFGEITATQTFSWTVLPLESAPKLHRAADRTSSAGDAVQRQLIAADRDGDALGFWAGGARASVSVVRTSVSVSPDPLRRLSTARPGSARWPC